MRSKSKYCNVVLVYLGWAHSCDQAVRFGLKFVHDRVKKKTLHVCDEKINKYQ